MNPQIPTLNILAYIHPIRTYLPCTGVGRHINHMLLGLANRTGIDLTLFFSQEWLGNDGKLDLRSPLRNLPSHCFPFPENCTERLWKLLDYPNMDQYLPGMPDWLYAPMETYIPVTKCPVAVTLHDIQAFEPQLSWSKGWQHRIFRYRWAKWVQRSLNHCRIVFTVSEFTKQRMVQLLGADPQKIVVIGNGVDQSFFDIASVSPHLLTSPVDKPYVLMIGGLRKKKGGDYLLSVAKKLRQRRSDIQLVIAGSSESQYSKAVIDHPNITLLNLVSDQDLPGLLRQSLCLIFLSLYEGFGIPALEAMAAGVPAVVSNRASLPEVVGDAGIIVDPTCSDQIASILMNLADDSQLHHQYVMLGKHHVAQYTWSRCVNVLTNALKNFS